MAPPQHGQALSLTSTGTVTRGRCAGQKRPDTVGEIAGRRKLSAAWAVGAPLAARRIPQFRFDPAGPSTSQGASRTPVSPPNRIRQQYQFLCATHVCPTTIWFLYVVRVLPTPSSAHETERLRTVTPPRLAGPAVDRNCGFRAARRARGVTKLAIL